MRLNPPNPSTGRLMAAALLLVGVAFAPACSSEHDSAQDVVGNLVGSNESALTSKQARQQMYRCGFSNKAGGADDPTKSFTTIGGKWNNRSRITYRYANFTPDLNESTVRSLLKGAFARWEAVAGLRFVEVSSGGDIVIGFYSGNHGDNFPFTGGRRFELGHATPPPYGVEVHFNDGEWNFNDDTTGAQSGFDLFSVALHEFGHALGLGHSPDENAVMFEFVRNGFRELGSDDIQGVRSLYPNDVLLPGKSLVAVQSVTSKDGRFSLTMQGDGNMVHYWHGHGGLWSTGTWGTQGKSAWMQPDGNFVLYTTDTPTVGNAIWSSGTYGNPDAYLHVQDDGNLLIRRYDGVPLWDSATGGH